VLEYLLNIIGSEWLIIIFIALLLLLGTNRFPEAVKKIGKIVGEYKKAKDTVEKQMKDVTKENLEVSGPVKDERQKLDVMSKTLGIDSKSKSDEELREIIKNKIGQPEKETQIKNNQVSILFLIGKHFFEVVYLQNRNIVLLFRIPNIVFLTSCLLLQPDQTQEKDLTLNPFFH